MSTLSMDMRPAKKVTLIVAGVASSSNYAQSKTSTSGAYKKQNKAIRIASFQNTWADKDNAVMSNMKLSDNNNLST